jgi:hypothetical protein
MQPRVQLGSVPFAVQALTVPDGSVTTAKIADGAVTQTKLAARAVTATTMDLSGTRLAIDSIPDFTMTGTSWQDIPNLRLTAPEPGIYLIMAHVKVRSSATHYYRYAVSLKIDGAVIPGVDTTYGGGVGEESTVMIVHDAALNAGSVVQVVIHSATPDSQTVMGPWTSMRMIRLSNKP